MEEGLKGHDKQQKFRNEAGKGHEWGECREGSRTLAVGTGHQNG